MRRMTRNKRRTDSKAEEEGKKTDKRDTITETEGGRTG